MLLNFADQARVYRENLQKRGGSSSNCSCEAIFTIISSDRTEQQFYSDSCESCFNNINLIVVLIQLIAKVVR